MWSRVRGRLRAQLRTPLFAATEWLWALGFACAGHLSSQNLRRLIPTGGECVLAIAPHPDDEVGCVGALALHLRAGDHVTLLQVTNGSASRVRVREQSLDAAAMTRVRLSEGRAASEALGVQSLIQWALPEGQWSETALTEKLRGLLSTLNPDTIYAPSCIDFHIEHLRVARALADALAHVPDLSCGTLRIRLYEMTVPLTSPLVNLVADTSSVRAVQARSIAMYSSQAIALLPNPRMSRYAARFYGRALRQPQSVQVFWQMSPHEYQTLIKCGDCSRSPGGAPYRSLRPRPFTDLLAYWRGRAQRRRLKRCVEEKY